MAFHKSALVVASMLPLAFAPSSVSAQPVAVDSGIIACPTQGELEQSLGSDGSILPEECTTLQINRLTSDNRDLCLIDFGMDQGFLGRLRDAAFPTQWWVSCDDLATAMR